MFTKIFELMDIPCENIKITTLKKILNEYEIYWNRIMVQFFDEIFKIINSCS